MRARREYSGLYEKGGTWYMTKKAMLSQPMNGKTDEEIVATRERAIAALTARGYDIVNTLFTDEWYSREAMEKRGVVQIPLCFLAKSLENMSLCMRPISARAGRKRADAESNTMPRLHTASKSSTNRKKEEIPCLLISPPSSRQLSRFSRRL